MDIIDFLSKNNIEPRKKLDQFFLNDESVLKQEVELADLKPDDTVLEIGPGIGNLTRLLSQSASVIAVEKDKRFIPYLDIENVTVIRADAVKLLKREAPRFNKVVSNVPYSISKKLLLELLQHKWELAVLLFQKEFVDKLSDGKLSIIKEDCCEFKKILTVPGSSFYPKAVDSSLIVLKQKKLLDEDLWNFVDNMFRHKNKDVKNVVESCPPRFERKKVQHLTLREIKELYELNQS